MIDKSVNPAPMGLAAFSFLLLGLVLISLDEYWQYLYG